MAKKESVGAIHDAVDNREEGGRRERQKIIVAGCLSQRFSKELPGLMPDVDAFIGLDQVTQVAPIIQELMGQTPDAPEADDRAIRKSVYIPDYDTPRFRLTPKHFAYVKIAEGCNHPCSFCIIPKIRGKHRSRTQESIVKEVEQLVASGVKEINLISQDTTYFGMDKWTDGRPNPRSGVDSSRGESLSTLIRALNAIEGDFWIRLLYTHPAHWSDDLIQAIAESPKVARYIDMPLQHISDHMLKEMKRETDGAYIRDLIARIRGHLHHMTRKSRWNEAMRAIQRSVEQFNVTQVGKTVRVLVEEPGVARTQIDAPDIDTVVYVDKKLPVGSFADVTVESWRGYDLVAA